MKVSYNWLSEYIDIPYTPEVLADKITMAGIEVEGIVKPTQIPEGVVVGEILERNPHPDADRLSICKVSDGNEELQIVCGASNCDAGAKIALATIGTVFIEESGKKFKIKPSKLRGVDSSGMLCSGKELGLSTDNNGLMHLPKDALVGSKLADTIKQDTIYEVEITPNRPDWLSHWGVARDIAALTGNKLKFPKIDVPKANIDNQYKNIVEVEDFDLCPRYTARIIKNVEVKDSPEWLQQVLISIGLRPINNIVDITNYILHELGHPLHAFDLAKLSGGKIVVRRAKDKEKIITLDEQELELNSSNLVIADTDKPVALAGVMGGSDTGVTKGTVDILLESASFFKSNIRTTSRQLGITSDSSYRFERGIDSDMVKTANDRASSLIVQIAGGELVTELIDVNSGAPETSTVSCRFDKIRALVGAPLKNSEITSIFNKLGLKTLEENKLSCELKIPTYRLDITREADLAEEVARIYGLDAIPLIPVRTTTCGAAEDDAYIPAEKAINELISLGLYETIHLSLVEEQSALLCGKFQKEDLIIIENPISLGLEVMRPSLFSELLTTVKRNISRNNHDLKLFEIGNVFCGNKKMFTEERLECSIALTGRTNPERFSGEKSVIYDFYDMKGIIESWLEIRKVNYQIRAISSSNPDLAKYAQNYAAEIVVHGKIIGSFGEITKKLTKGMRINNPLYMAVIQLDQLLKCNPGKLLYKPISQFPSTTRDVAFIADKSLEHMDVINFIGKAKLKNLEKVELFDIFLDESLGENKKSMAYALTFRNAERTLTDKEVNAAFDKLRENLESKLSVELR